jgi:hypothetical protein
MNKREILSFFRAWKFILILYIPGTYWVGCYSEKSLSDNSLNSFVSSFIQYMLSVFFLGAMLYYVLRGHRDTHSRQDIYCPHSTPATPLPLLPTTPDPHKTPTSLAISLLQIMENFIWMKINQSKQWEQ